MSNSQLATRNSQLSLSSGRMCSNNSNKWDHYFTWTLLFRCPLSLSACDSLSQLTKTMPVIDTLQFIVYPRSLPSVFPFPFPFLFLPLALVVPYLIKGQKVLSTTNCCQSSYRSRYISWVLNWANTNRSTQVALFHYTNLLTSLH